MTGVQTCALRSEEHTSELQSHDNLVCRLLLEKKEVTDRPISAGGGAGARSCARRACAPPAAPPPCAPARTSTAYHDPLPGIVIFFFKSPGTPRNLPFFPPRRFSA